MTTRPIDPLDLNIWKYDYVKCAVAIDHMVPFFKKLIDDSDKKLVIAMAEDVIKEMGPDFKDKDFDNTYINLKFAMMVYGIVIKSGDHTSGKKLFLMRHATYRDKMPEYWKKRSKFLKRLMKSDMWKEMTGSRADETLRTK